MPSQIYAERNKPRYLLIKLLDFKSFRKESYLPEWGMGDGERRENAQRQKCLETDISSTTLNALDGFKDKDCDSGILNSFKLSFTSKIKKSYEDSGSTSLLEIITLRSIPTN